MKTFPFFCALVAALLADALAPALRAQASGSLDADFNPGSGVQGFGVVFALAAQADGKIILGGDFTIVNGVGRSCVARLNADGSLDAGFDPSTGTVYSAVLQSDGKIILGGDFRTVGGVTRRGIARLNADGSADMTFDPGAGVDGDSRLVSSVAVQADGKIIIGGSFYAINGVARTGIARLNANGTVDTSFNPGSGVGGLGANSIAVQSDGKIVIGGFFGAVNGVKRQGIARLNADGSLDASFNPGPDSNVVVVAAQSDGKIVLGGGFTSINGVARHFIARLNSDGSLDTAFNAGTVADQFVQTVAVQSDGKIVMGGGFTTINGTPRNRIARLNVDGSLDTAFNPGAGADNGVLALVLQSDGKIVMGGSFTAINGTARNRIARLNGNNGNPAPLITSALSANAQAGQFFSYQTTAANNPTSFGASNLPAGLSINSASGLISGTPSASGTYQVLLSAANASGANTATLSLTVAAATTAPAPVITSATSASAQAGSAFSYQITAANSPTSFGASGLPSGLSFNAATGLIAGTPAQSGAFFISLSAINASGSGAATLALTILPAPATDPVISSAASASAQAGQGFAYQISASNQPTGFGASGLPTGLSLNASTGLISGAPTSSGLFTVSLYATNASGTGAATLTLTVAAAPKLAPVITSALSADAQEGQAFRYQIAASNAPASYRASGLPAGLNIDPNTGLISGAPTQAGVFRVTLSAIGEGGAGDAALSLTVAEALPTVTLSAAEAAVTAGSGGVGKFAVNLSAPQNRDLVVRYTIKGSAINGGDYVFLNGVKKFKAGKTSKPIKIIPLGNLDGAAKKTVKITLAPGAGYTVGTTSSAKVKILAGQ